MSVPTHFRYVIRGSFKESLEKWSNVAHFRRDRVGGSDAGTGDVHLEQVVDACKAFFNTSLFPNTMTCDDIRFYQIGTNGKMEGNAPALRIFAAGECGGTGNGIYYPPQVSLVATLVAPNRGPAKFGRQYLPTPNLPLGSDSRIPAGLIPGFTNAYVAYLKGVCDSIDYDFDPAGSELINVSPGPIGSSSGTKQTVDHVEIGRVLDTQRNRRKSLLEERVVGGHIDW